MDYEVYNNIKKGSINTLRELQSEELPWAWFVCSQITEEVTSAAELLRLSWTSTVKQIVEICGCPAESFKTCLAEEIYRFSEEIPKGDEMFSSLSLPTLPRKFDSFAEAIKLASPKEKRIYLLNKLGGLGNGKFAEILGISLRESKEYLYSLERKLHPCENGKAYTEFMYLSNEFRYTNGRLFEHISLPELFISALEHDYNSIYNSQMKHSGKVRKDLSVMSGKNTKTQAKHGASSKSQAGINRRAAQKRKKIIIISAVSAVLLIAAIAAIVIIILNNNRLSSTRITTYNIDEVTYGNVSTTISGSGSLSPVTKETLTISSCIKIEDTDTSTDADTNTDDGTSTDNDTDSGAVTQSDSGTGSGAGGEVPSLDTLPAITGVISDVEFSVGDTVDEGDVIAVVTFDDDTTADIVAPYDAVLLEFYLHEDDVVTMTSSVAMFMGTDGYSMTVSVDETNISTIELGQEVAITIDAVSTDEDIVGSVTDISYNGSTSGSVTAYGITVTFDYVEGTYPGMSVSAEIVIEDSGDGLLVPVDAVYTSGDTKYIYLAPSDAEFGAVYEEGDIDTSKLTKITVETGMSDGSFIIIESDELEEGDLIVITTITSTLTGLESEGGGNSGTGGFGGGGFGGGGGFPGGGNFDFGDFDPSQFGGGFPGMN